MSELIVALDVPTIKAVENIVKKLDSSVDFYKIGLELFSAEGPAVVALVKMYGKRIFLDLKLHDIPRTVERAVQAAAKMDVDMLTIHASGGRNMIAAAKNGAQTAGAKAPAILAVTTLTSLDVSDLKDLGINRSLSEQVSMLGVMAVDAGADGVVCSPLEVARLRKVLKSGSLLVTPGVRPQGVSSGDQKRVATPAAAVAAGSTHLVVGRPILEADEPKTAAINILEEMRQVLA